MQKVQPRTATPVATKPVPIVEKPSYSQVLKAAERMLAVRKQKQSDVQAKKAHVEAAETQIAQLENCLTSLYKTNAKLDAINATDAQRTSAKQESKKAVEAGLDEIRAFSATLDHKLAEHGAMCAKFDDRDKDYLKLVETMKKRVASLTNCVQSKQQAIQVCKTAQTTLESELQELYSNLRQATDDRARMTQERQEVKENIDNLQSQVAAWKKEDEALDDSLHALIEQVNETTTKNKQLEEVKKEAAKDIALLQKDIAYVMEIESKASSLKYDQSFVQNILQYTELMQAYHISDVQMVKDQCKLIRDLQETIDNRSKSMSYTQASLDSVTKENQSKSNLITQLTKELATIEAQKRKTLEEKQAKNKNVEKVNVDHAALKHRIQEVEKSIVALKNEATEQQKSFSNAQQDLERRSSNAMSKVEALTKQIGATQNTIMHAKKEYATLGQSKQDYDKQAAEAKSRLLSHNMEFQNLFATEQQVLREVEKQKEMMSDCAAEIKSLIEKQEVLDAEWKQLLDKRAQLKDQNDKAKAKLELDNEARKASLLQKKEALYAKQQLEMRQFEAQLRQESQSMVGDLFMEQAGIEDLFLEK